VSSLIVLDASKTYDLFAASNKPPLQCETDSKLSFWFIRSGRTYTLMNPAAADVLPSKRYHGLSPSEVLFLIMTECWSDVELDQMSDIQQLTCGKYDRISPIISPDDSIRVNGSWCCESWSVACFSVYVERLTGLHPVGWSMTEITTLTPSGS
jgi:hypothetical protein